MWPKKQNLCRNIFSYYDDIFADVNVGIDDGGVNDGAFADEHVVADLKGKEGNSKMHNIMI